MNDANPKREYFHQTVEDGDFAIIFDEHGRAKGIWLPEWFTDEHELPDSIKLIMGSFFGDSTGQASRTLH